MKAPFAPLTHSPGTAPPPPSPPTPVPPVQGLLSASSRPLTDSCAVYGLSEPPSSPEEAMHPGGGRTVAEWRTGGVQGGLAGVAGVGEHAAVIHFFGPFHH